ncbi:PadR family transcriptional regulator [Maritimibacter sp. 55A14]|uniref:bifunctional helix-turn-helix transcriptional regulator/GNAT family N-acetyltransferase n=1 Tax=Maritimibacter sp. 55A14 TaxID=2174844 RepID=UPI000D6035E7|nr:helix-turn-helix domain-containing GNAT family N-acetyltransferase [Maritimibacter sp. 55A14]PWE29299.1 PadR family transcriptional regulator [Maritimibacter sp. 55A14]
MFADPISRLRRFNRAVTSELGVLDNSFLGRGRPLGAARVIHAIGPDGAEVGAIRNTLNIDKALLSRLLKSLITEGLAELHEDPADARRRIARLTPAGRAELDAYNALSDAHARALLDRHPAPGALLEAIDLVASALARDRIGIVPADPRRDAARRCLEAYYEELAHRIAGGFDVTQSCDPDATDMTPPRGAFFLAVSDGLAVGCAGLKGSGGPVAEVKRLWVAPGARGLGLAGRLMRRVEDAAHDLGIATLRLDTNSALPEAVALYRNAGWTEIDRFNDDPYPDIFFEKHL